MMRVLAFILSLFIVMLAMMPCSDAQGCETFPATVWEWEESHAHDHSEDSEDYCTPFCTCYCCGLSFLLFELQEISLTEEALSQSFLMPHLFDYAFSYPNSIWVPPASSLFT